MGRKAKTDRVPKTRAGGEWTEAAFWSFLRSNLRMASKKWPPLARLALEQARRQSQSDNKRLKWEFQCADCKKWFPRKEVQVDHIVACGTLASWDDLKVFAARLFCEVDGLMVRCTSCHRVKTNSERES